MSLYGKITWCCLKIDYERELSLETFEWSFVTYWIDSGQFIGLSPLITDTRYQRNVTSRQEPCLGKISTFLTLGLIGRVISSLTISSSTFMSSYFTNGIESETTVLKRSPILIKIFIFYGIIWGTLLNHFPFQVSVNKDTLFFTREWSEIIQSYLKTKGRPSFSTSSRIPLL